MNRIKKGLLLTGMLLTAVGAFALKRDDPYFNRKIQLQQRVLQLKQDARLNEAQVDQILTIFAAGDISFEAIMDSPLDEKQTHKAINKLIDDEIKAVGEVLTKEQIKDLRQIKHKQTRLNNYQDRKQP